MDFVKTGDRKLSGVEKAAILLAEIGPGRNSNYAALEKALNLTAQEKRKIRKAMENLPPYNPAKHGLEFGMQEIKREQAVLNELLEFGFRRGIYKPVESKVPDYSYIKNDSTRVAAQMAMKDPAAVAKILGAWLGE